MKRIKQKTELSSSERWEEVRAYAKANDVLLAPEFLRKPGEGRKTIEQGIGPFEAIEEHLKQHAYEIEKVIRESVNTQRKLWFAALPGVFAFLGFNLNTIAKLFANLIHHICQSR